MAKKNEVICIAVPPPPDMKVCSMLFDTLGPDMAPKVPNKIYNTAAVIDEPVITFVAFTDGSERYINSVV